MAQSLELDNIDFKSENHTEKKDENSTSTCGRLPATAMSRPFEVAPGQRMSIDTKLKKFWGKLFWDDKCSADTVDIEMGYPRVNFHCCYC